MRRHILLGAFVLLLAGCGPREPLPGIAKELELFDADLRATQEGVATQKTRLAAVGKDFRGRTPQQDLDDWVLAESTRRQIEQLRAEAAAADNVPDAVGVLYRARDLVDRDEKRAQKIEEYWTATLPAPFWRRYWDGVYEANGVPPEQPDSMLESLAKDLQKELDAGDFSAATRTAPLLIPVLHEALDRAAARILKLRPADAFVPRKSACLPGAPPDRTRRHPRLSRAESLERFYPAGALERGEAGTVVLRARVDRKGCATAVSIAVRSGVPALDEAALLWFESAQFAPAWADGKTIDDELTFKMKFVINEKPTSKL
jgi:TonB family protein